MLPVYLVHWRAPEWCREATESLLASDVAVSVTVIDNSGEFRAPAGVSTIKSSGNPGFAGGMNLGLRGWLSGDEEYCLVGSHDLTVGPEAIGRLVAAAEENPGFGILGPDMPSNGVGELVAVGTPEQRTWVTGGCMLLRRACIEAIGLFDEDYGSYREDVDLCHRAWRAGWRIGRIVEAKAQGRGTSDPGKRAVQIPVNRILFLRKHEGAISAWREYLLQWLLLASAVLRRGSDGVTRGEAISRQGRIIRHGARTVRGRRARFERP